MLLCITRHTDLRLPDTNTKCDPEYLPEFLLSWFLHKQIYKIPKLFLEYHRVHDPVSQAMLCYSLIHLYITAGFQMWKIKETAGNYT